MARGWEREPSRPPRARRISKAQLELLSDGTYRFMVIEPRMLMMVVGLEKGKWKRAEQQLHLTPFQDQVNTGTLLRSAPKNFRPKALAIDGDAFLVKDEQMDLRFEPNPEATEKLRESGDI